MDAYEVIELVLDASKRSNVGRTAIQKLVYLAQAKTQSLDTLQYRPHYYGPYSSDLSLALERLVAHSFVDETLGHQYEGYKYQLTSDGADIVSMLKESSTSEYQEIENIVNTCKELCGLGAKPLSCAAKVLFIQKNRPGNKGAMTVKDAKEQAKGFGWDISDEDIERGAAILERLDLVKSVAG